MQYLPRSVDPQFMVRFIQNHLTPEEKEFFVHWLEESDAHKEEFAAMSLVWDRMGHASVPMLPETEAVWEGVRSRIVTKGVAPLSETSILSSPRIPRPGPACSVTRLVLRRVAPYLIVMVLLAMGGGVLFLASHQPRPAVQSQPVVFAGVNDVVTRRGERVSVHLSDGSIVYLNAGSRLRYPASFAGGSREVELEGEGYFAVQAEPARPFRVRTGSAVTEVKGTEFNVRYRGRQVQIVVARGAVQVFDQRRNVRIGLVRGEASEYNDSAGFSPPHRVDVRRSLAWRENKLSFERTPLAEVLSEIELFYDVRVVVKRDRVLHRTLTGYFASDSLDEVLSNIALAMDVRISRNGQTVTVH